MTIDELRDAIYRRLGDVRGRGGLYVVPSRAGEAFLMCTKYPIHSSQADPLCTHVPLAPPSDELVSTLQLYLAA